MHNPRMYTTIVWFGLMLTEAYGLIKCSLAYSLAFRDFPRSGKRRDAIVKFAVVGSVLVSLTLLLGTALMPWAGPYDSVSLIYEKDHLARFLAGLMFSFSWVAVLQLILLLLVSWIPLRTRSLRNRRFERLPGTILLGIASSIALISISSILLGLRWWHRFLESEWSLIRIAIPNAGVFWFAGLLLVVTIFFFLLPRDTTRYEKKHQIPSPRDPEWLEVELAAIRDESRDDT